MKRSILYFAVGSILLGCTGYRIWRRLKEDTVENVDETASAENGMVKTKPTVYRKPRTKITRQMVKEWSDMAKRGVPRADIAKVYNVSLASVNKYLASVKKKAFAKANMKNNKFKTNKQHES